MICPFILALAALFAAINMVEVRAEDTARTVQDWIPILETEASKTGARLTDNESLLASGVFFYRNVKRKESRSLKLYPEEQAAVDAYVAWYSEHGEAAIDRWLRGDLNEADRRLESVIAWSHFMREWEKEKFRAEGPSTACPGQWESLGRAAGVGTYFMNEPWRSQVLDGYSAVVHGYCGMKLARKEVQAIGRLWNILILKSGDDGCYLPRHIGLDRPFDAELFDPATHQWPGRAGRGFPADLIGRPLPDILLPRLDAVLARPGFKDLSGRRDDPEPLFRPGATRALPFLGLMRGYEARIDAETGLTEVTPLLSAQPSIDSAECQRLSELGRGKIVLIATGNVGDPYVNSYLPALAVLKAAYGDRVEFAIVAGAGSAGYKGYRFPFHATFFGERPVKLHADIEDVARYCKRWMMNIGNLDVPVLLENEYYHFTEIVQCRYGNDDFTLLDSQGRVAYIKGSRRTGGLTPSVLLLNLMETEIQALLANGGRAPADHTADYFNPWELWGRLLVPQPGGGLKVREDRSAPEGAEYPFDKSTLSIYGDSGRSWFVGRIVGLDAEDGTISVRNAQTDPDPLRWYMAWSQPNVMREEKTPNVREYEKWLERGETPIVFKIGPKTTTWLNGTACVTSDYSVGDRVGVYYRFYPVEQDLGRTVEATHVRVSRVPDIDQ